MSIRRTLFGNTTFGSLLAKYRMYPYRPPSFWSERDSVVKRIPLTGISGVAKSTVTSELARRGYKAVDADGDEYSEWVCVSDELRAAAGSPVEADRDWAWREDRMQALLSSEDAEVLFVKRSGYREIVGSSLSRSSERSN